MALGVLAFAQGALGRVFEARPRRRGRRHLRLGGHGPQQGRCQRERLQSHRTAPPHCHSHDVKPTRDSIDTG
ncbi:hypothetical protein C2I33_25475 [Ralstonia solanacearum]|nr:hypothetical protein C2I33_25475 [Ralstonia solanacearum]